jgi:hypothetical protein
MRTVNDRRSPLAIVCIGSEQVANMEKSRSGSVKTNLEPATAGEKSEKETFLQIIIKHKNVQ